MRDTCIRTKIKFIGDDAERLNIKQNEWLESLPEFEEKECLKCEHGNLDFCQSSVMDSIIIRLQWQSEKITPEVAKEDFFLFKSTQDAEDFAKMLFFLWNNDGSTLELDFADLYQHFSSSGGILRPIIPLTKEGLVNVKDGAVACFSLGPGSENALADIYKIASYVDNEVGEEVICLITDLVVPKIKKQELAFFYTEKHDLLSKSNIVGIE